MPDLIPNKTITTTKNITRFEINIRRICLNQSATLEILLYDGETFVDFRNLELVGSAYDAWGADDNYLISYVETWLNENL